MRDEIIFHHYLESPVSEKVRVVFGIKGLQWRSVRIPRVPPRPALTPMTGGYRRTPVMQIGADIYCDSDCIIRELQRRYPGPTLYPGGADGLAWAVAQWAANGPFQDAVTIVLSNAAPKLDGKFAADRGRLYFGDDFDFAAMAARTPELMVQLRGQFQWIEQRLACGRAFMLGDQPGLPDAACYYLVWFLRGRWDRGPAFFKQFTNLEQWEQRVAAIGHGASTEMTDIEALDAARDAEPATPVHADPDFFPSALASQVTWRRACASRYAPTASAMIPPSRARSSRCRHSILRSGTGMRTLARSVFTARASVFA